MNVEKSELKMLITKEVGKRLSAQEEAAKQELYRNDGAIGALKQGIEKLENHKGYYKKKLMGEEMSPEEHTMVVTAIDQCKGILTNLSDAAFINKQIKQGEVLAFGKSENILSSMHEEERAKLETLYKAIEDGTITPDSDGSVRPSLQAARGKSVVADLNERRAKAAKEKAEKKEGAAKKATKAATKKTEASKKRGRPKKS